MSPSWRLREITPALPRRLTAADHRRRLKRSDLYQRRERDGAHARMLAGVKALLYLSEDYVERWPERRMRP